MSVAYQLVSARLQYGCSTLPSGVDPVLATHLQPHQTIKSGDRGVSQEDDFQVVDRLANVFAGPGRQLRREARLLVQPMTRVRLFWIENLVELMS
jgi:hypothetical protein